MMQRLSRRFSNSIHLSRKDGSFSLAEFNVISDESQKLIKSVTNTGFKVDDLSFEGPIVVLNASVYMWDVPQYGVGGPADQAEPLGANAYSNPTSPFHGWTTDMLKLFEIVERRPGTVNLTGNTSDWLWKLNSSNATKVEGIFVKFWYSVGCNEFCHELLIREMLGQHIM